MPIRYAQPSAPPAYVERGLRYMAKLGSTFGEAYTALVDELAQQIVQAGRDFQIPALPARPTFDADPVAFNFDTLPGHVSGSEPQVGPRKAMFLIVAASPQDLSVVRKGLDPYEAIGGL